MDNKRKIPTKNYIILGVVIVVSILILNYFYMWFDAYKETKLNMPILNRYLEVINYNELDDYLTENPDSIIYVSVLENEKIREFEKKFKALLRTNEIDRRILYLNITDDVSNSKMRNEMSNKYNFNGYGITDVPIVLVFNDGVIDAIYSVRDNNYDIDMFKYFINNSVVGE